MSTFKHDLVIGILKLANPLLMTTPFCAAWFGHYANCAVGPISNWECWLVALLFLGLYTALGKVYDGFLISYHRISEIVYSQMLAAAISMVILYMVICLLARRLMEPAEMIIAFIAQLMLSIFWALCAQHWYFSMFPARDSIIISDTRQGLEQLIRKYAMNRKFNIRAVLGVGDVLKDKTLLNQVETVFFSGIHSHDRNILLKYCIEQNISVYVIPRIGDVLMSGAHNMHLFHLPMLRVERYHPSLFYLFLKRSFDVFACGAAILVLLPVFIATAIAIKSCDGGPVLYKQKRLTKDGKVFEVLKFRSMRVDAEKDGVAKLSTGGNDERVTPVGRFIRKVRIDELPQLLNILKGDMTICGPRPERPEIAAQYEKELPEFHLRLQAKAGLTGYAQVYGKYNTTPYDKLIMDLMYIAHPSFLQDLQIMFATAKILFQRESTEGVAEEQMTVVEREKTAGA